MTVLATEGDLRSAVPAKSATQIASFVVLGSLPIDELVIPQDSATDSKRPARITDGCGGAFNASSIGAANGIPTIVVGAQATGRWADYCEQFADRLGVRLLLVRRADDLPARSVIVPNGAPGRNEIYAQRARPLRLCELTEEMCEVLRAARALLVGPMVCSGDGANVIDLLARVCELASDAYRGLLPHPSLVKHPGFGAVARRFSYVQMNAGEARLLPGATADISKNALRLRKLTGEETDFAITNGPERGWLWADGSWYAVNPIRVGNAVDDTGCGDAFGAAWVLGRSFLGTGAVETAHGYALRAAANVLRHPGNGSALPYK